MFVKAVPKYFLEFINNLLSFETSFFKNPFINLNSPINTSNDYSSPTYRFFVKKIIFANTKNYGFRKIKKKGVVKRKIIRKVYKNNLITD
jgi:hypothetical protein